MTESPALAESRDIRCTRGQEPAKFRKVTNARLTTVDTLRGFGLLGVAICNAQAIAGIPVTAVGASAGASTATKAAAWVVTFFLTPSSIP